MVDLIGMGTEVVIYELKVSLKGTLIWRRIRIPEHFLFVQLHAAICQSFNWINVLGHRFECELGEIDDNCSIVDVFDELMDRSNYTIHNSVERWRHNIRFERRIQFRSVNQNQTHAICTSGRWARPPERCGGLSKFNVIRRIFADPSHYFFDAVSFYISGLNDVDAEWTKQDGKKIGPMTLSV